MNLGLTAWIAYNSDNYVLSVHYFALFSTTFNKCAHKNRNFEISKRTENTIKQFMSIPHIPNKITKDNMQVNLLSLSEPEKMRKSFLLN